MSLVGTLGKMAAGVIIAKGVGSVMKGGGTQGGGLGGLLGSLGGNQQGGGLGGLLGSLGGNQQGGGLGGLLGSLAGKQGGGLAGGLGGLLGSLTGGGQRQTGGGLGDILGSLSGGGSTSGGSAGGGLGDLIGMLGGAGGQQGGGLGGILDSLGSGSQAGAGGLGSLLNGVLQGNQTVQPTNEQEQQAEIMLRAMISAAKADGEIDAGEQQKITEHLDDVTPEELALVRSIMNEPNDMQKLVNSIPAGMEQQAYFMSLLAINLDSKPEAQYLHQLAQSLNISHQDCNSIHEKLGAPVLYT